MNVLNILTVVAGGYETQIRMWGRKKWSWEYARRKLRAEDPKAVLIRIEAFIYEG